ncbi:MAG: LarC family nickel insertion protein, partial [Verrucomicrobiota bacterium]
MRVLFLDCFSGISGDMTVGALADLGVKPSAFEWELSKLEIGDFHMHFERKSSQHITGIKFDIHEGATHGHGGKSEGKKLKDNELHPVAHEHGHQCKGGHGHCHGEQSHEGKHEHGHSHEHEHGHHHHGEEAHSHSHEHAHEHGRNHAEIRALIQASSLSEFVKTRALSIFHRIAVAEGKIHGVPPEDVQFHEVGALDSIADVVLACAGIEALGVEKIFVSPLIEGSGWIDCAHGKFPIPAPATLEILT